MSQYCIDLDEVRAMIEEAKKDAPQGVSVAIANRILLKLDKYEKNMRQEERNAMSEDDSLDDLSEDVQMWRDR